MSGFVTNSAIGSNGPDAECIASINRLAKLDSLSLAVIQATKEKMKNFVIRLRKTWQKSV